MVTQFELLKKEGVLGFYQSCEVTMIFVHNKISKRTYNLYTIVVFEEKSYTSANEHYLPSKRINEDLSLGIFRYHLTLDEVTEAYMYLSEHQLWKYKEKEIRLSDLKEIEKVFVKCNGTENVPLNSILKNNFYNGSYIIEFFDMKKSFLKEVFSDTTLKKMTDHVRQHLPIDLEFISDRIGNIVFQFPSNLMGIDCTSTENWNGFNIKLVSDPKIISENQYALKISDEFDGTTSSFNLTNHLTQEEFTVVTGNSRSLNNIQIIDTKNQLLLSSQTFSFMQHLNFSMDISTQFAEPRTIIKDSNHSIEHIEIVSQNPFGTEKSVTADDWIRKRKYKNEKRKLMETLEFVQYGKYENERARALKDIRELINRHGREGVYLWDPYLTSEDILNTLYYCRYTGVEMKAITSFDKKRMRVYKRQLANLEENMTILDWHAYEEAMFQKSSNHLGINLEFRCQHENYGWKFHDRFLIFPSPSEEPKVWSLGISVNGLGKEHHILQLVSNPQNIIDAFDELWEALDSDECIIWRSR